MFYDEDDDEQLLEPETVYPISKLSGSTSTIQEPLRKPVRAESSPSRSSALAANPMLACTQNQAAFADNEEIPCLALVSVKMWSNRKN